VGEGLPPAAVPLLRRLGAAERLTCDGHLPSYGSASAWGSDRLRSTDYIRSPYGHGWHLDRPRFESCLRDAAGESGASLALGARVTEVVRAGRAWDLTVTSAGGEARLRAAWLIDATGRSRWLARRLGVRQAREDRLLGIAALFRSAAGDAPDPDSLTLVEAVAEGWWYTARLPGARRVVVYLTDADTRSARAARRRDGFLQLLAETGHIRARLEAADYRIDGSPRAAPAESGRLALSAGEGWLAAGDAAAAYDPLSSQGILSALYSGVRAGETVDALVRGDAAAGDAYARQIDDLYNAYRQNRALYYAGETRWPEQPFWSRRHG
jgi:flavin-dependent dehydrogenase